MVKIFALLRTGRGMGSVFTQLRLNHSSEHTSIYTPTTPPIIMTRHPKHDKEIEEAIKFLVFAIHKSERNPKPVILHSIKVGLNLYNVGCEKDIVIAAILHDVIEDANVSFEEVRSRFGKKVSELVKANSFDEVIEDKTERYKKSFARCKEVGKDALIIKAADFLDNCNYYHLASGKELQEWLFEKLQFFIENSRDILKDETLYKQLEEKHNRIRTCVRA